MRVACKSVRAARRGAPSGPAGILAGVVLAGLALGLVLAGLPLGAHAATIAVLSGAVVDGRNAPVAGAEIRLAGGNLVLRTVSGRDGHFAFAGLDPGTYELSASGAQGTGRVTVDLRAGRSDVVVQLLGTVASLRSQARPTAGGSGTDLLLNATQIEHSPVRRDLAGLLLQTPGAARGANGVVHVNGDHGDINYIVDGVPIPQELNRQIGGELDPADLSFVEVLEGAYPAQYGERFAAVVNANTRVGSGSPGFDFSTYAGSFAHSDTIAGYHGSIGPAAFVAGLRAERGNRTLDPPGWSSPHDAGSNVNAFVRVTLPSGRDFTNFTAVRALRTFQIPPDIAGGAPAASDDVEKQDDLFLALQHHHATRNGSSLVFGGAYKRSRIRDFGDPNNDYAFGINANLQSGGALTDCARGSIPACGFSLFADRTATDYRLNADGSIVSPRHDVRYGALYDVTTVVKRYAISLQPMNYLAPILTPSTPNATATVVDNAPNAGHTESLYLQDTWRMSDGWRLDYGVRQDAFQIASTQFAGGFAMTSPRVKLTRLFSPRSDLYAYYGRFFTPFSFENVSPAAAQLVNLPVQPTVATFDLRPQRDSVYEAGGHLPLGGGTLGWRVMQKNATDLLDDTQVSTTALHQDINYARGSISVQSLSFQQPLARSGKVYVSISHARSVNIGCETQLLAPCFGAPNDWTPADHDQRWSASGGAILNDARGGWFTVMGEFGSGLSSASCDPAPQNGVCKVPPHLTIDAEKGFGFSGGALVLTVRNLFNDRYFVTFLNAQGNHVAPPRTLELGLRLGR